ncbi:MAG TPA: efflux RND transporter periplasmic adaptor subunit [Planctomycetaceae bacterium]|nr:efflux RND transporter periplasmic adaptor subunit [Planctomycetaceae bacterium]
MTRFSLLMIPVYLLFALAPVLADDEQTSDQKAEAKQESGEKPAGKTEDAKQESDEKKGEQEAKKPEKNELKLSGVLEAESLHEIILRPEVWSSFKVEEAAEHGARIKADSVLIRIETKDIDRKIDDTRRDLYKSKLALQLAEQELEFAKKTYPIDRELTERSLENAKADLKYFLEVTLPYSRESAKRSLQRTEFNLEYNQEELTQLEKMYQADELTEETEEIILKRTRRDVEESKYSLDRAQERTTRSLEVELPRQEELQKASTQKTILETEKSLASQEINMRRRQHDLEQQQINFDREEEALDKLLKDRNMMIVKSPADGIVYYGQHARGRWAAVATIEKQLRKGGAVTPNAVMLTVVDPGKVFVRIDVAEKDLKNLPVGTKGIVTPTAFPDLKLEAEVSTVSLVPISDGKFDGKVTLNVKTLPERLVPGMGCEFIVELPKAEKKPE